RRAAPGLDGDGRRRARLRLGVRAGAAAAVGGPGPGPVPRVPPGRGPAPSDRGARPAGPHPHQRGATPDPGLAYRGDPAAPLVRAPRAAHRYRRRRPGERSAQAARAGPDRQAGNLRRTAAPPGTATGVAAAVACPAASQLVAPVCRQRALEPAGGRGAVLELRPVGPAGAGVAAVV